MKLLKSRPLAFASTETVVAATILGLVIAVTIVTLRPSGNRSRFQQNADAIVKLQAAANEFQRRTGVWPDSELRSLHAAGLTESPQTPTPYGGYYRFDLETKLVVDPLIPR